MAGTGMPCVDGRRERPAPAVLGPVDLASAEVRVEQQVRKLGVAVEGLLDLAEERARMMQPPRHIEATPPLLISQPILGIADRELHNPWA